MKELFRTLVPPIKSPFVFSHQDAFLMMGSCFSENIGDKLRQFKFDVQSNPMGISYNPISLHKLISVKDEPEAIEQDELYFSYDLHSMFTKLSRVEFKQQVEKQAKKHKEQLAKKGILFLTYGTAWVYELNENGQIVNNCHKQPAHQFSKRLLSVDEIVDSFEETLNYLSNNFPQKRIVFTVSPVRHLKDGIRENQLSKATLHLAIQKNCEKFEFCSYFPSYEIMMDDLRDYRFYSPDMIHPNQMAIDYIWDYFSAHYFDKATGKLMEKINSINSSVRHRPFLPEHPSHQKFLQQLLSKAQHLQENHSLNFTKEIDLIKQQLKPSD